MYSDSDHTSEHDLVSRLAYLGFMNGNLVSWKSKKLAQTVSMSSCESEFYASELSGADAMFLRRMQFGLDTGSPPTSEEQMKPALLFMDNQAAIKVLQQDGFSNRTKHISVRFLWVKQEVLNKRLVPKYISTHQNLSDALTKPLKRSHLFRLLAGMGLRMRSESSVNGGECGNRAPVTCGNRSEH
jgi:hypothetical protein